jgi:putative transposase
MPRAPAHARLCVVGVSLRPLSGLPGDLEAFVDHYNHQRYYESINNVTSADVYTGRGQTILLEREKTKRRTLKLRRLQHAKSAA